jgi:hypothetical protein
VGYGVASVTRYSTLQDKVLVSKRREPIAQWCGVMSQENGNLKNPFCLIMMKNLRLQKNCLTCSFLYVICWKQSLLLYVFSEYMHGVHA